MVMRMIDYLTDRYEIGMTIDRAAMLLIEARFPVRLIGENIHSVFQHTETLMIVLTTKKAERI